MRVEVVFRGRGVEVVGAEWTSGKGNGPAAVRHEGEFFFLLTKLTRGTLMKLSRSNGAQSQRTHLSCSSAAPDAPVKSPFLHRAAAVYI